MDHGGPNHVILVHDFSHWLVHLQLFFQVWSAPRQMGCARLCKRGNEHHLLWYVCNFVSWRHYWPSDQRTLRLDSGCRSRCLMGTIYLVLSSHLVNLDFDHDGYYYDRQSHDFRRPHHFIHHCDDPNLLDFVPRRYNRLRELHGYSKNTFRHYAG